MDPNGALNRAFSDVGLVDDPALRSAAALFRAAQGPIAAAAAETRSVVFAALAEELAAASARLEALLPGPPATTLAPRQAEGPGRSGPPRR